MTLVPKERGGALVEAIFVLPVLLTIALGSAVFGSALSEKQILTEATRFAARRVAAQWAPSCSGTSDETVEFTGSAPRFPRLRNLSFEYSRHRSSSGTPSVTTSVIGDWSGVIGTLWPR